MLLLNSCDISSLKAASTALETARDAAEAANQAKSRFLANMSHEIRTPMNGVLGLTSVVLAGTLDEGQRRYLQMAHDSAQALMVIINDLLDLSKIEADKMSLQIAPVSLRDALQHGLAPLAVQAAQRGLTLAWDVAADVPGTVLADGLRWGQVLLNLAGNALKFTNQGRIDVSLARAPESADGVLRLRCSVRDTGIGMTPEQLAVVFDPFTQADDSITRRYGGTGLGLTIARRLVQLMGGQIDATSQPGQGSCFQFVVPVDLPPAP
jgi:signal transduction histidine kinase